MRPVGTTARLNWITIWRAAGTFVPDGVTPVIRSGAGDLAGCAGPDACCAIAAPAARSTTSVRTKPERGMRVTDFSPSPSLRGSFATAVVLVQDSTRISWRSDAGKMMKNGGGFDYDGPHSRDGSSMDSARWIRSFALAA